ncbi:hypothetical protein ABZY57_09410 [Streptomyces sp. NPDC006450]
MPDLSVGGTAPRSGNSVAAACLVVGYEGSPLDPLFVAAPDHP